MCVAEKEDATYRRRLTLQETRAQRPSEESEASMMQLMERREEGEEDEEPCVGDGRRG